MPSKPKNLQYTHPFLEEDEGADDSLTTLNLGSVVIPVNVPHDKVDKVLYLVTELVSQMVEEDITPEFRGHEDQAMYEEEQRDCLEKGREASATWDPLDEEGGGGGGGAIWDDPDWEGGAFQT